MLSREPTIASPSATERDADGTEPVGLPTQMTTRRYLGVSLTLLTVAIANIVSIIWLPKASNGRLAIGIVSAALVASLVLWLVPKWQVRVLTSLKPNELFEHENEARKTLAQILGGIVVLAGLYYTSENIKIAQRAADEAQRAAIESRELTRQGQITDRFTKAVEQLGKEEVPGKENNLAMRLGGIYALERIAKESKEDYWPIVELLVSYAHQHARLKPKLNPLGTVRPDVQAVLTALGRRNVKFATASEKITLTGLDLRDASLTGNFNGVFFDGSNLQGAGFREIQLEGATFVSTELTFARFQDANLKNSVFNSVTFSESPGHSRTILDFTNFIDVEMGGVAGLGCDDIRTAHFSEKTSLPSSLGDCSVTRTKYTEFYKGK
jgi:pentapeptide repeat protein